jgi:tRNA nucleotidyltransferase (CCA-adding enzyme)
MTQRAAGQPGHWEHFSHMADIGIRGMGITVDEAFAQAAVALTAVITDPATVRHDDSVQLDFESTDLETLLFEWLNALIYEMAVRKMLFGRFQVHIDDCRLQAQAWGERIDRFRHQPAVEVKGATYTELRVTEEEGVWIAQCIIDV